MRETKLTHFFIDKKVFAELCSLQFIKNLALHFRQNILFELILG